jgi:hydroxyethylthiazole kinase
MRVPKRLAAKRAPARARAARRTTIQDAFSPQAVSSTQASQELKAGAAEVLDRVRSRMPRVHCITNMVAQNFSANMLLALGAVPSMTIAPDEVAEFAAEADALLVNLGTFDAERRTAAEIAIRSSVEAGRPWVLDPVFVERSKPRTQFAKKLVDLRPQALRLNRAEYAALAGRPWNELGLRAYALETEIALGVTGETDLVTDGERTARIANGHSLMAKVTAMGCAASAVVAACLAVEPDAWRAVVAGLMLFGVAGEIAGARATGPGSFAAAMLDAVYALNGDVLVEEARVAC